MSTKKNIITILHFLIVLLPFYSCTDDILYNDEVPDGRISSFKVSIDFDVEKSIRLTGRSYYDDSTAGGENGDAIQNINSLWMVIYDSEGNLKVKYPVYGLVGKDAFDELDIKIQNVSYKLEDNRLKPEEDDLQDKSTGHLTYDLTMPTGSYYIYAVANVDDFENNDISNRDKLKNIAFNWNADISKNSQMFGVFSVNKEDREQTDNSPIILTRNTTLLHAWAKRLASKVTVAFDGSMLYDNVQIFIYDISLHDIPKQCKLGIENRPGWTREYNDEGEKLIEPTTEEQSKNRYDAADGVDFDGGIIKVQNPFSEEQQKNIRPEEFLHICNGKHKYLGKGSDDITKEENEKAHKPTARSLFFFENVQGKGKSKSQTTSTDTTAIAFPNPIENDLSSGWKDNKPYGTYVEVRGFYRNSSNSQFVSSGNIVYRFMLGQDTEMDYNAYRNTHYKLTLVFKGNGNDADWHIEYEEKLGLHASSPQYISYLYNKDMNLTVKITGTDIRDSYWLRGEIVGCNDAEITDDKNWSDPDAKLSEQTYWRPWGDGTVDYPDPSVLKDPITPERDLFYTGITGDTEANGFKESNYYGPWVSFLSMRKTEAITVPSTAGGSDVKQMHEDNTNYFNNNNRGWRNYSFKSGTYEEAAGNYRVEEGDNCRVFTIPLYTRAKELVTTSGFTGNNPYTAYPRRQRVKFYVAKNENGTRLEGVDPIYVDIIQVRRIVNPKGVWRSGDTPPKPFHVTLMWLKSDNEFDQNVSFEAFESNGPWSAEIVSGSDNIISLETTQEGSGTLAPQTGVRRIEGATEHNIDFKINYTGQKGCAVIRVRYHNYTCEHDIFCRVGYGPIEIGGNEWQTVNVDHFDANGNVILCKSPLQEGGLFKKNCNTAILPENNVFSNCMKQITSFKVLNPDGSRSSVTWNSISPDYKKSKWKISNSDQKIPSYEEFKLLQSTNIQENIKKAYGVLYGDGAEKVAETLGEAYGYDKTNDSETRESTKGMRGVFVYDPVNMHQIFFPISKTGMGHIKMSNGYASSDKEGSLRYAGRSEYYGYYKRVPSQAVTELARLPYVPMFADLYRRTGAVYWVEEYGTLNNIQTAFDMNYHTMGFKTYGRDATNKTTDSDACYIRTIMVKSTSE